MKAYIVLPVIALLATASLVLASDYRILNTEPSNPPPEPPDDPVIGKCSDGADCERETVPVGMPENCRSETTDDDLPGICFCDIPHQTIYVKCEATKKTNESTPVGDRFGIPFTFPGAWCGSHDDNEPPIGMSWSQARKSIFQFSVEEFQDMQEQLQDFQEQLRQIQEDQRQKYN